jgi:hypothetical protein
MNYTLEDINSKLISSIKSDYADIMNSSLDCYNYIMEYLDSRGLSYKIVEYKHEYNSYKEENRCYLQIVLEEYLEEFIKAKKEIYGWSDYLITLSCDMERTKIEGNLNSFLCARKWDKEVKEEFHKRYPDYHLNIDVNYMDYDYAPDEVFFVDGEYDYHAYYRYINKDRRDLFDRLTDTRYIPKSSVNVFLSMDISEEEQDKIYRKMKPFFKKYHINTVYFIRLSRIEIESIIRNEKFTSNSYNFEPRPIHISSEIAGDFKVMKKYDVKKKPKDKFGFTEKKEGREKKSLKLPKTFKKVLFIVFFPLILIWTTYLIIKVIQKLDE